jgi:hypothetical protein
MTTPPVPSFAQQWARKYVNSLLPDAAPRSDLAATVTTHQRLRAQAATKLLQSLRTVSLQAWAKTETLLAKEVQRHQIDWKLINPWQITHDCYQIYEKALELCSEQGSYRRLPAAIAPAVSQIRKKYTAQDPRVIGFVSMQFHYTGLFLEAQLSLGELALIGDCFKIVDDHLYMPLHRAYAAAAGHSLDSPILSSVQKLMPASSEIARTIVQRVAQSYSTYATYSGLLTTPAVQRSSLRDVEMFQVYLWVCALEQSLQIIQDELFPLCVMIYPPLNVHWELVRQMVYLLGQEIQNRVGREALQVFTPYLLALQEMFSPLIFPERL